MLTRSWSRSNQHTHLVLLKGSLPSPLPRPVLLLLPTPGIKTIVISDVVFASAALHVPFFMAIWSIRRYALCLSSDDEWPTVSVLSKPTAWGRDFTAFDFLRPRIGRIDVFLHSLGLKIHIEGTLEWGISRDFRLLNSNFFFYFLVHVSIPISRPSVT